MERGTNGGEHPADPAPVPLTATQEGMWFAERLDPGRSGYHDAVTLHLVGPLDLAALRQAFLDCHHRHDALRLRIQERGGRLTQTFDAAPPTWRTQDLTGLAPDRQAADCRRRFALDCTEPFDLADGPLWRTRLLRLADEEHRLLIVLHHLMTDGWSHGVFLQSVLARYGARLAGAPGPAAPAPSFRQWALRRVAAENAPGITDRARQAATRLRTTPRRIALPGLTGATGTRGGVLALPVEPDDLAAFDAACASVRVSRFMAMTGLLAHLVGDLAGTPDLVVSAPVADRLTPEATQVLGCTINAVPIRFGPIASPADAAAAGRAAVVSALGLLDVPYREIIRAAEPSFTTSLADPLTNVSCEEYSSPRGSWRLGGLTVTALPRGEFQTRHDLLLSVPRDPGGGPELIYPVRRWQPDAVAALAARLAALVRAFGHQVVGPR
ncbi:Condensation domain-containing protein [Micromonospora pallida]|uniref:Condensation domain-containing protein n=1 Tax=Micromonospora pallida TaxID=145854 RepID=A0A1C6SD28_9ACTN|nr:condensation domain-containing protein [Micromonospora pallida]SCL27398.1 Condensation domain-containing protein [Micromonospora pallida]